MSDGINTVILAGGVGSVELRQTQSSQAVLNIRLATSESYVDANKERKERTDWHNVVMFGRRAEALAKHIEKGSRLTVQGRLQTRSWDDKNGGGKRYSTEIVATNIVLSGGGGNGKRRADSQDSGHQSGSYNDQQDAGGGYDDESVPF